MAKRTPTPSRQPASGRKPKKAVRRVAPPVVAKRAAKPKKAAAPATALSPAEAAKAPGPIKDRYDYVRTEEAPRLPAPRNTTGLYGWARQNLFSSPLNVVLTLVVGALALSVIWRVVDWAIIRAAWTGENRDVCAAPGVGACWPFAWAKIGQWIYGFYPIDQRWRPNLVFIIGGLGIVPMLIPSLPYKKWNGIFLLVVFPLITVILLTGGHFDISWKVFAIAVLCLMALAAFTPVAAFGLETGMQQNRSGFALVGLGLVPVLIAFFAVIAKAILGLFSTLAGWVDLPSIAAGLDNASRAISSVVDTLLALPFLSLVVAGLILAGAILSLATVMRAGAVYQGVVIAWLTVLVAVLAAMALLGFDFGLSRVETNDWGGLLVTLVVSITGIVASLPIGILMALGRRSTMPVIKAFSVLFIELWRGVPLITVLFMASVMLPLFFPAGTTFDKLIRVLIGIALFSAAYMAEVVRSGLQAIGKGQYEGAMALGLSYWQMMVKIILPQALKVAIPNIVGNFIGLFKDTTLVTIIGLFDFLGIIVTGANDSLWASSQTGPTGYFVAALGFWIFCFGMSRYAAFIERRLNTGHKR